FIGPYIARAVARKSPSSSVQLASRSVRENTELGSELGNQLLPSVYADVTEPESLSAAFEGATAVVNAVGIMHEQPPRYTFQKVQSDGARNLANAARAAGARLVHISAIGADPDSNIPYAKTKGLGEKWIREVDPDATIIRPSLVFGKEDDFFNRFAKLAKILPFIPVFGGGHTKFQPVYVEDLANAVSECVVNGKGKGKIVEAGGPKGKRLLTFHQDLMRLMLEQSNTWRPVLSVPWFVGTLQGFVLEKLPVNLFTITRDQVTLLKSDNIVTNDQLTLKDLGVSTTPADRVLHTYL
ncbi:NAD(P)-binding protein, partial [Phlyctochytrium arcticum]